MKIAKKSCAEVIQGNGFISAIEIECFSGKGRGISRRKVMNILESSEEIRYYPDDLLLTYDIYYKEKQSRKMARVLLAEQ